MPDVTIVLPTPPTPARAARTAVWTIDLDSDDATDAAVQALEIMRDPASVATVFRIYEPDGRSVLIDVEDPESPRIVPGGADDPGDRVPADLAAGRGG